MIVKNHELKRLDLLEFKLILFYGKNEGLKFEIIENFLNKFKGQVYKYDENEFIGNFDLIFTEMINSSLFDDKKLIILSRITEKIFKYVEEIDKKNTSDVTIILNSGVLEKKSKLRNLFEKNEKMMISAFYEDDNRNLSSIVLEFLNKNNIKLSRESINLIISRASGDRKNLKLELNKLLNFSFTNKNIDYETVENLTNLAENYDAGMLADYFLLKNNKNLSKILNENNYSGEDCILILRTILKKSKRLLDIIKRYEVNKDINLSLSNTKPPIFWKEKENVKKQVFLWKLRDLQEKIYELSEIEILIKSNSNNSLNIVSDFIVNV
jgi:DNA polymerase-3 subunit delta